MYSTDYVLVQGALTNTLCTSPQQGRARTMGSELLAIRPFPGLVYSTSITLGPNLAMHAEPPAVS